MMKTNYLTSRMTKTSCRRVLAFGFGFGFSLLATLSGCQAEDGLQDGPQDAIPIGFSSDVSDTQTVSERQAAAGTQAAADTRAATEYATEADIKEMGVLAYFPDGNRHFNPSASVPNFMYNQKVVRQSSGIWTYSPVKYWPNNPTDEISFFAYAPYVDHTVSGGSNPTLSSIATKGFPTLTYTVPTPENSQVDLLAATPLLNRTYAMDSGKLKFAMKHALTKVGVFIKSNDDATGKKVTAFSITSAKSGTLTYHGSTGPSDIGFSWGAFSATQTYTPANASIAVPDTQAGSAVKLCTFFLLPQGTGSTFNITYTYSGTTSGSGAAPTHTVALTDLPLPSLDKWGPGASVSYTIGIEKTQITVTSATHPAWSDEGSGTVTGTFTIVYGKPGSGGDPSWGDGGSGTIDGQPVTTEVIKGTAPGWGSGDSGATDGKDEGTIEPGTDGYPDWGDGNSEHVEVSW